MGRIWIEDKGLGLFRARRKNSRKWLEGYYVRVSETAGNDSSAVRHYIIFQKTDGSGRMCRAEVDPDTLCRCTGMRDKNSRLIFEHDIVRRKTSRVCPIATQSAGAGLTMMRGTLILTKSSVMSLTVQSAEMLSLNRTGGLITARIYGII